MPSPQAAFALITANSIGVSVLGLLIRVFDFGNAESVAEKATIYKRAKVLLAVTICLGVSFASSLVYLYAVEFNPIFGVVSLRLILVLAAITLYIGIFGPVLLLLLSKIRFYKTHHQKTQELIEKMRDTREEAMNVEEHISDAEDIISEHGLEQSETGDSDDTRG